MEESLQEIAKRSLMTEEQFLYIKLLYPNAVEYVFNFFLATLPKHPPKTSAFHVIFVDVQSKDSYAKVQNKVPPNMIIARVNVDYGENVLGYGTTSEEAWGRVLALAEECTPS